MKKKEKTDLETKRSQIRIDLGSRLLSNTVLRMPNAKSYSEAVMILVVAKEQLEHLEKLVETELKTEAWK